MQRLVITFSSTNSFNQCRIIEKFAAGNRLVDALKLLKHHATRADVKMPNFRITHLPAWQANEAFRGINQGMRVVTPKCIPIWLARLGDGVVSSYFASA